MDVREAANIAKIYVRDVLADEGVMNIGLEEVEFDDGDDTWEVTVGFSRPWNSTRSAITTITGDSAPRRTYRVVKVRDEDGRVLSMKQRERID